MVGTRSTTLARVESPAENHKSESESSDEDDEDIPSRRAVSTPIKHNGVVTLRPQYHRRPSKRPHDDDFPLSRKLKRQKTSDEAPSLRSDRPSVVSSSSLQTTSREAGEKGASDERSYSGTESAENEVSDELVQCVSSILTPGKVHGQQQTSEEPPREQLPRQERLLARDHNASGEHEIDERRPGTDTPHSGIDHHSVPDDAPAAPAPAPDNEPNAASEDPSMAPDSRAIPDEDVCLPPAPHKDRDGREDPYEIPLSPPPTIHLEDSKHFTRPTPPKEELPEKYAAEEIPSSPPMRDNLPSHIREPRENGDDRGEDRVVSVRQVPYIEVAPGTELEEEPGENEQTAPTDEKDVAKHSDVLDKDSNCPEISDSQDTGHSDYDSIPSPTIQGLDDIDGDVGDNSDIDLTVEESFSRDVEIFRNRRVPEGEVLIEGFEGPPEDDCITVHIEPGVFKQANNLMRVKAWAGLRLGRQIQTLDANTAETQPGRSIMPLLAKLMRLYVETPRAPHLIDQNRFLAEHSDMISYYFSKIDTIITHIRRERLERLEHSQSAINQNEKKRSEMAGEIVSLIIPMILRVLASVWRLAGDEDDTQFTMSTVEFLRRGIGWVRQLYHRALNQLSKECGPRTLNMKKDWEAKQRKRAELGTLLSELIGQIDDAPDMLLAKEHEEREKLQKLRMQKAMELQWEKDMKERQLRVKEQNRKAILSIEGKSVTSTSSPSPSRRTTPMLRQAPQSTSPWSREEKEFLFKQLRQSFPQLPDLAGYVRQELNRSPDDIKGMARVILRAMLKEAYEEVGVEMSATDREVEIENIFKSAGAYL